MLQHFYAHNKHKKVRIVGNCNVSRLLFNPIFSVFPRNYLLRNKADASSLWTRLSKQYIADFRNENCTLQHHHMVTFKCSLSMLTEGGAQCMQRSLGARATACNNNKARRFILYYAISLSMLSVQATYHLRHLSISLLTQPQVILYA